MELEELKQRANSLCQKHWGVEYTGKIKMVNYQWRRKNAHFEISRTDPNHKVIVFSKKRNAERSKEEILGTLLHELVHWRLHCLGLPNRDDDKEFVLECIKVGARISGTRSAQRAAVLYGFQGRRDWFEEFYGIEPRS